MCVKNMICAGIYPSSLPGPIQQRASNDTMKLAP